MRPRESVPRDSTGSQSEVSGMNKGVKEPVVVENKVMELLKDLMGTVGGDPIELKDIPTGAAKSMGIPEPAVVEAPLQEQAATEAMLDASPLLSEEAAALGLGNELDQPIQLEGDDKSLGEDGQEEEGKVEEASEEDDETWSVELNKIYPGINGNKAQGHGGPSANLPSEQLRKSRRQRAKWGPEGATEAGLIQSATKHKYSMLEIPSEAKAKKRLKLG